jgi:hypothetical protein
MNIVRNLRACRHIGSMCMTRGFGCCINATGMRPLLVYLVSVLGRVSMVEFNRQNRIQMLKNKGSLS